MTQIAIILAVLVVGALVLRRSGTLVSRRPPVKTEAKVMEPECTEGPEALRWLETHRAHGMFAGNRFEEIQDAIDFVRHLYALGAVSVIIPEDSIDDDPDRIARGEGPGADALVVFLPEDKALREKILAVISHESEEEGFDPVTDEGQRHVSMWWD